MELRVEVNDVHEWLSGRTYAETAAWAKVLIDRQVDRIIGAHIVPIGAGHALNPGRGNKQIRDHARPYHRDLMSAENVGNP